MATTTIRSAHQIDFSKSLKFPFRVEGIEVTSPLGFWARLKKLITNPFVYLFTGKISW